MPENVKYRDEYTKRIKCYSIAGHRDMIDRKIDLETGVKCMVEYHYIHKRKIIRLISNIGSDPSFSLSLVKVNER